MIRRLWARIRFFLFGESLIAMEENGEELTLEEAERRQAEAER